MINPLLLIENQSNIGITIDQAFLIIKQNGQEVSKDVDLFSLKIPILYLIIDNRNKYMFNNVIELSYSKNFIRHLTIVNSIFSNVHATNLYNCECWKLNSFQDGFELTLIQPDDYIILSLFEKFKYKLSKLNITWSTTKKITSSNQIKFFKTLKYEFKLLKDVYLNFLNQHTDTQEIILKFLFYSNSLEKITIQNLNLKLWKFFIYLNNIKFKLTHFELRDCRLSVCADSVFFVETSKFLKVKSKCCVFDGCSLEVIDVFLRYIFCLNTVTYVRFNTTRFDSWKLIEFLKKNLVNLNHSTHADIHIFSSTI